MSYHEAALRLRCPVGTIGVRLKRARERLRARLIRRGVVPSAGLLAALLYAEDAPACVPPVLVESTVQAAMGFAASNAAAAGLVSSGVVAVSDVVLWAMAVARLKVAMTLALTLWVGAAALWIAMNHTTAAPAPSGPRTANPVNESSCVACHGLGAPGGAGPENKNVILVTATPIGRRLPKSIDQIHPGLRGSRSAVVHRYGTHPEYAAWRRRFYEPNPDGGPNGSSSPGVDPVETRIQAVRGQAGLDSRVRGRAVRLNPANGGVNLTLSERNTPALFGSGRIDAIPSELLVVMAESQPPATRGRVSRNRDGRIARFGWKAQIASLHEYRQIASDAPDSEQCEAPKRGRDVGTTAPGSGAARLCLDLFDRPGSRSAHQ